MIAAERLVNYRTDRPVACGRDASPRLVLARDDYPSNRRAGESREIPGSKGLVGQKSGRFERNLLAGGAVPRDLLDYSTGERNARGAEGPVCKGTRTARRTRHHAPPRLLYYCPVDFRRGRFRSPDSRLLALLRPRILPGRGRAVSRGDKRY